LSAKSHADSIIVSADVKQHTQKYSVAWHPFTSVTVTLYIVPSATTVIVCVSSPVLHR
jgi:hypothetical protein